MRKPVWDGECGVFNGSSSSSICEFFALRISESLLMVLNVQNSQEDTR
jgi:hypothetical protein